MSISVPVLTNRQQAETQLYTSHIHKLLGSGPMALTRFQADTTWTGPLGQYATAILKCGDGPLGETVQWMEWDERIHYPSVDDSGRIRLMRHSAVGPDGHETYERSEFYSLRSGRWQDISVQSSDELAQRLIPIGEYAAPTEPKKQNVEASGVPRLASSRREKKRKPITFSAQRLYRAMERRG